MLSGQKYGSVKSSAPGLGSTMCHNNQSARDDIADKDFVCDRQIWFLFAWEKRIANSMCVELFRESECAQLNQVRRGHGVLDVIWEEIWVGGWAGDTQDIWYGQTNLKFAHKFTKTKERQLQMFPQMRNSVTYQQLSTSWKSGRAEPIKSDKAKICRVISKIYHLPMISGCFLHFSCQWQIPGGARVISSSFSCDGILSDRKQCPAWRPWYLQWQNRSLLPSSSWIDHSLTLLGSLGEFGTDRRRDRSEKR